MIGPQILKSNNSEEKIKWLKGIETENQELKNIIYKKTKGLQGEANTEYHLNYLSNEYLIIHNIKLEYINDMTAQIDHIVLSEKGIFILDTKQWTEKIKVEENGQWVIYKEDPKSKRIYKEGINNPFDQLFRHEQVLKGYLHKLKEKTNIDLTEIMIIPIVVMGNHKIVTGRLDKEKVVSADAIARTITEIESNNLYKLEDLKIFAEYILEQNIENEDEQIKELEKNAEVERARKEKQKIEDEILEMTKKEITKHIPKKTKKTRLRKRRGFVGTIIYGIKIYFAIIFILMGIVTLMNIIENMSSKEKDPKKEETKITSLDALIEKEEIKVKTVEMEVMKAAAADVGRNTVFMNKTDMMLYHIFYDRNVKIRNGDIELEFPLQYKYGLSQGQISLEQSIRDQLNVNEGDIIEIIVK